MNNVGFVISKEDLVSGPETRLDHSGLLVIQMVRNLPAVLETWVQSLGWEIPWRRAWQPTPVFLPGESPSGSVGKESACNAGDLGLIPGLGRSLEKGKATHSSILAWKIPWTV